MFVIFDYSLKMFLFFWLGAFGVGFVDMALKLHDQTALAYKRGPISASTFTHMMIDGDFNGRPLYSNELGASKGSQK